MILNLKIDSYNVKTKIKTSWQNIFIFKKGIILYEGTRLLKPNLWILLDALLIQSASMKKGKKIFYICNICYEKGKCYCTGKLMLWMPNYFFKELHLFTEHSYKLYYYWFNHIFLMEAEMQRKTLWKYDIK